MRLLEDHMSRVLHRIALTLLSTALLLGITAVQAGAQNTADRDTTRGELTRFDTFLDDHPQIGRDLRANPSLVNNREYEENHPELREFLSQHPGVREEIRENPAQFMKRETRFERNGGDITRAEAARFDGFLDNHPEIARDLRKNPGLVDNREYVENHPELREFLKTHPEVREDLRQHPRAFMKRERQYEHHEGPRR
jgi:hypothetical protein